MWQELLMRMYGDPFATTENKRRYVKVVPGSGAPSGNVIAASAVGDWAEKPLRVLLENQVDAVLIRLCSRLVPGILAQALIGEWVVPYGCGGTGEVMKQVEGCGGSERLFVLIDSDRESLNDRMSDKAKEITKTCVEAELGFHVLERRELENYVPGTVWEIVVERWKKTKKKKGGGTSVLVYRWIARELDKYEAKLTQKYSKQAVTEVRKKIKKSASADVSQRLLSKLLDEWHNLSVDSKAVDDLKERFGEKLTQNAIKLFDEDQFDLSLLDPLAVQELKQIAHDIEEWL